MAGFNLDNHNTYREISSSVTDSLSNINNGSSPTEAVVKTAKDKGLNMQKTLRVLEAVNNSLTLKHYEKNASARGFDFDIADRDKVISEVFGNAKMADDEQGAFLSKMAKKMELEEYIQKNRTYMPFYQKLKKEHDEILEKVAGKSSIPLYNSNEDTDFATELAIEQTAENIRTIHNEAMHECQDALVKLAEIFSRVDTPDPTEFIKYATVKYYGLKPLIGGMLDYIYDNSTNFGLTKVARETEITPESLSITFEDEEAREAVDQFVRNCLIGNVSRGMMKGAAQELIKVSKKKKITRTGWTNSMNS